MILLRGIMNRQSRLFGQNRLRRFWKKSIGQRRRLEINKLFSTLH